MQISEANKEDLKDLGELAAQLTWFTGIIAVLSTGDANWLWLSVVSGAVYVLLN